jgi:hypothetical protein
MKFTFIFILITLLILRRISRGIGFQKFSSASLIVRMIIFAMVALFILAFDVGYYAINSPVSLIPDAISIVAGLVLAYIATNHAQFENRENGLYFKTHVWVEITVIILFLARFIYRVFVLKDVFQPDQDQQDIHNRMKYMRDPASRSVLFVFCTYYLGYFSFVLKEGKKVLKSKAQ